jgi:hypothetical protein
MNSYRQLLNIAPHIPVKCSEGSSSLALFPTLGGRVFAEVAGESVHRVDLSAARNPSADFNNYGGNNFWPAPEGGEFGFNYRGDEWYVQDAINLQPFKVDNRPDGCTMQKEVALLNRHGIAINAIMQRELKTSPLPQILKGFNLKGFLSYTVHDLFKVTNKVDVSDALLTSWTLEQFDTSDSTVSFCKVANPEGAINFDFYNHPEGRILYKPGGFLYKTDGRRRGQIGVKLSSNAEFLGFYDLQKGLLVLRENLSAVGGLYFNIADNNQPEGAFSAADNYSIFNSDTDMSAFELETVGAANVDGGTLLGSQLTSRTSFAVFSDLSELKGFVIQHIGGIW